MARLLPKLITFEPPPCIWFMEDPEADQEQERQERDQQRGRRSPLALRVVVDALLLQQALEGQLRLVAGVVRLDGRRVSLHVHRDLALVRVKRDLLDRLGAVAHQALNLEVGRLLLEFLSPPMSVWLAR